jgi:hypothetical protein
MANMPIRTGRSLSPPLSSSNPKVNLKFPVALSIPGNAAKTPSEAEKKERLMDLPPMEAIKTSASKTREKKSKGPNFVEYRAIGAESIIRKSQDMHPPTKEAVIPKPNALPGLPSRAIGYPSIVVMIEAGVPGIRNNVAVINPPLTAPTYMLISRMNAFTGSILNVSGKVRAINIAPVNPGIAPIVIPKIVPRMTKDSPCRLKM